MDRFLIPSLIVLLLVAVLLIVLAVILLTRSKSKLDKKDEAQKDNAKQEASRARVRLAEGFRSSLSVLQSKLSDKDFLYRVPWVLALGETNSGKTSLLRQLDGQSSGNDSGVEWFFLQHGALLDIPGDFLIGKDGTTSADGRWKKLLKLLVRYRPHRPIDGILLTIPAPSMMGSSAVTDSQRMLRATAIRNQLDQLQTELRMVVPIYILITKCDQVRGFHDFCEQLDPASRNQMFGWSSASTLETSYSPERVDEAFSSFALRLLELQIGMFSREVYSSADNLFLFPGELERMRAPVKEYLTQIFQETSYVEANFLRGIYFCGEVAPPLRHQISEMPALESGHSELAVAAADPSLISLRDAVHTIEHSPASHPPGRRPPERQQRIAFVRHLLDLKVFPEAKIARPTRGILLTPRPWAH